MDSIRPALFFPMMNTQESVIRPAWFHFALSGGVAWLAVNFWKHAQAGNDLAAIGAVVLCLLSCMQVLKGFAAWFRRARDCKMERQAAKTARQHGEACWAILKDVKKAGMLDREGLFLGDLKGRDIYYPGETHLLTIAPPGAGKGVCFAVPNLLHSSRSMIVADPKGELWAMTGKHREEILGHKVIVLCPWAEKMSEELGLDIPDHGFNPFSGMRGGPDLKDEIELRSNFLLPGKPNMNASSDFFNDGGQSLLTGVTMELASKHSSFDLPMLRRRVMQPPEQMFDMLDSMAESDAFGGSLREIGGQLLGALKNAPQQFEGILGSAQKALRIYDSTGPLAKHVSHGTIDFSAMKDTPTTVYLIMPSDRASTHAAWLNLVISLAIELVGRDRSNRKVLFLLDEFANLGFLPSISRGMAQYRGQGVQVWAIIQQLSQLERLYGREGMRDFLGMSEIVNTFGVWEPDTLNVLSKWLGSMTVRQFGQSITPALDGGRFGFNYSASDMGAPLMRPEDIRTMPQDEQLIFYRNLPPIRAKKISYLERKSLRKFANLNPYHRKSNDK